MNKRMLLAVFLLLLMLFGVAYALTGASVLEWEHGWKTKRVVATRYENPDMGYNIGFKFPLDQEKCDRQEIFNFMETNGGYVYEGGGSLGAEMFVVFKGVHDKDSANKKIKEILPNLDRLMTTLR